MGIVTTIYDIQIKGNAKSSLDDINKAAVKANASIGGLGTKLAGIEAKSFGLQQITRVFSTLTAQITKCTEAYRLQAVAETKLATIMRKTMDALPLEIDSIKKLAAAQQKLGVISDEIQLSGAQELSTYLTKTSSLKKLIPVMNDMLAQQYGLNATQEQAVTIAQMMGKVLDGQVGALSRYGYRFDDAQEAILKFGNEEQRVAMLAQVISQYVGGVNAALAQTPEGKLKQHANNVGNIREEWGRLFVGIQSALLPLREKISAFFERLAGWFEQNKEQIQQFVVSVASFISGIVSRLESVAKWIFNNYQFILLFVKGWALLKVATLSYSIAMSAAAAATKAWTLATEFNAIRIRFGLGTATRLMWGFNAAVKANPIGLLVSVVTTAITAFALFQKRTSETTMALDDAKKVASDYYAKERSQLDTIFAKLRETNPKSAERNRLVNELLQMYPELNRQQAEELRNTNNLAATYETLAAGIAKKARIKGMESAIESLSAKTADIDMAIEEYLSNKLKRDAYASDEEYYAAKQNLRKEAMENLPLPTNALGGYNEVPQGGVALEVFNLLISKGVIQKQRVGVDAGATIMPFEIDGKVTKAVEAHKKIDEIQKFLSSYMFEPGGLAGSNGGGAEGDYNPLKDSATEITSGGKGVKNFYITIGNLLGENTNIFQSSGDSPETASGFLEKLKYALESVVNDVNYAAG